MANRRDTFAKRQRETDLKDKARQKQERRNAKKVEPRTTKGPQIAWDEMVPTVSDSDEAAPAPAETPAGTPAAGAPVTPSAGPAAGAPVTPQAGSGNHPSTPKKELARPHDAGAGRAGSGNHPSTPKK